MFLECLIILSLLFFLLYVVITDSKVLDNEIDNLGFGIVDYNKEF